MSRLTLVRHGQARAFEDDSDRLSAQGEKQARCLAQYWTARRVPVDEVYTGTLLRQRQTAAILEEVYRAAGLRWPDTLADSRLNEFDSHGILTRIAPELEKKDPRFAELSRNALLHRSGPDANRHFQRMFEVVMNHWVGTAVECHGVESWNAFQGRVQEILREIVNGRGEGRNVVVVTSGGPIATAVQTALAAPHPIALELNWRMRNCSITEFLFRPGRLTLDLFNAVPHLEPDDITYR